ncbi:MAG: hypothetical protein M3Y24_01440 [Acidobacteriota bacterium]|nr:hypothetical protein [Acidobacteriota bacterium]
MDWTGQWQYRRWLTAVIKATANIKQHDTADYGPSYTARGNIYDETVPWGSGDPSGSWSQSFTVDGFGNLNQITSTNTK